MKTLGKIILCLPFCMPLLALGAECSRSLTKDDFKYLVEGAQKDYFPELSAVEVGVKEFVSEAYYFQAKPVISSLFGARSDRSYFVEVNSKLFNCPPPFEALKAIIVHEFEHIKDYHFKGPFLVAWLGIRYSLSKQWRAKYERETDLKVVEKGLAKGLAEYRRWIYPKLSPKELKLKKYFYLTPEELGY